MALDFFAGCVGGAAGVVVGHPLDTVKVRLQTQTGAVAKYRGTFHCLSTIVKQESITGLYKGISSPLVGVAGVNALIFGIYGMLKPYVSGAPGHDALWAHFAAGSVSGACQSLVASPMELVKTRMQIDESSVKRSPWDVIKNIYNQEGGFFRGIYKGWRITVAREIPAFGIYFSTYEALTTLSEQQVGTFGMLMAGGTAGVASWIFTVPIDVVKTRIQCDTVGKYSGAIDCFKQIYKAEGYPSFFRGLTSSLIRAFPTNAATFTVVTYIMRWADEQSAKVDDLTTSSHEYVEQLMRTWEKEREKLTKAVLTRSTPEYMSMSTLCAFPRASNKPIDLMSPVKKEMYNIHQAAKTVDNHLHHVEPLLEICENENRTCSQLKDEKTHCSTRKSSIVNNGKKSENTLISLFQSRDFLNREIFSPRLQMCRCIGDFCVCYT